MLLDEGKHRPFSSPDFLYEIKFDGYRVLAEFGAGHVELRTRGGASCGSWFPEVVAELSKYTGGPYIVDGEVSVLDEIGRSDFNRLHARAQRRRWYPGADAVTYCIFDLLLSRGVAIMDLPLFKRKARLIKLFTPPPANSLMVVSSIPAQGEELFSLAVQLKLEGLVAKHKDSLYLPGQRSTDWIKLKRKGAVPAQRFKR